MIALTNPECLQGDFDTLTGLFDRVGLQKNVDNTVGMRCRPFRAVGTHSDEAYARHMMGVGLTYQY